MPLFKIFISSVQKEFASEREALFQHFKSDALLSGFFEPVLFEKLPAASSSPGAVYIDEVGRSLIYLGLLGADYGYEDAEGISPTEREYDHATLLKLERWIFLKGGGDFKRHEKEAAFVRKVGDEVSRKRFTTTEELLHEVDKSCVAFLKGKQLIGHQPFDAALQSGATLEDIDDDKIGHFIDLARFKRGFPLAKGTAAQTVLAHLNMLHADKLTNSALLAFGKKPQRFFPAAVVKCARFHGLRVEKPIPDHKVFSGDVFAQVDQAVDFVLSKLTVSVGTRDKSVQAPIQYEIPPAAITEAIVNAVAHRDYTSTASVQVMVFADRVEITNPGRLAPELSIPKLKMQHASYPVNPLLAECLYQAGYIERFGTGTLEIIRLSEEAKLEEPDFDIDEGFKVVLWRPAAENDQEADKHPTSTRQVPDKYPTSSQEVQKLLKITEGEMKSAEIQKALKLKDRENFRDNYLLPAIEEGFLEMTHPESPKSPKQRYRLTEKGKLLKTFLKNR